MTDHLFCFTFADGKRELLGRAPFPEGFKSPLQFDQYTLNHSAFVGMQEVAWVNEFEQELERREVFVKKGTIQNLPCKFLAI